MGDDGWRGFWFAAVLFQRCLSSLLVEGVMSCVFETSEAGKVLIPWAVFCHRDIEETSNGCCHTNIAIRPPSVRLPGLSLGVGILVV